jgi:L-cysteine desulfidase
LTVEEIVEYAGICDLERLAPLLKRQVELNMAIAEEGLSGKWGANIGKILLTKNADISKKARAYAAAGSDARMSGCELPVSIISGSGNQGITASVPVAVYARELGKSDEELYRALIVSNLVTIHQKTGIGTLSAYCGAISAGVGAGAGICYLLGGDFYLIAHTLVNAVAILSGTICDGAKPSCAAKIAMAVEAGIMGYEMWKNGSQFHGGDGIVTKGVENTIKNVGRLAKEGMSDTDREIIEIMLGI